MKAYYLLNENGTGNLIATHTDDQNIDPSVYGPEVKVLSFSDESELERVGSMPMGTNIFDIRPIKLPKEDLNKVKTEAKVKLLTIITQVSESFTSNYPATEMLSWGTKEVAARAYLAKEMLTDTQKSLLDAEFSMIGGTMEDLCNSIITNADKFSVISGLLAGFRASTAASIDSATSEQAVDGIISGAHDAILTIISTKFSNK